MLVNRKLFSGKFRFPLLPNTRVWGKMISGNHFPPKQTHPKLQYIDFRYIDPSTYNNETKENHTRDSNDTQYYNHLSSNHANYESVKLLISSLWQIYTLILSDSELCHSILKSISDEEDIFKSFMTFDIVPCGSIFRVVVKSQLMIPHKIHIKIFW